MQYCNFLCNPIRDIVCRNISNMFSLIKSYNALCLCTSYDELNSFSMNKTTKKYVPLLQNTCKNSFSITLHKCMHPRRACLQGEALPTAALRAAELPAQCKKYIYVHVYKCNAKKCTLDKWHSNTHPNTEFAHSLVDKVLEEGINFLLARVQTPIRTDFF